MDPEGRGALPELFIIFETESLYIAMAALELYIDQAGPQFTETLLPLPPVLGLKVC